MKFKLTYRDSCRDRLGELAVPQTPPVTMQCAPHTAPCYHDTRTVTPFVENPHQPQLKTTASSVGRLLDVVDVSDTKGEG